MINDCKCGYRGNPEKNKRCNYCGEELIKLHQTKGTIVPMKTIPLSIRTFAKKMSATHIEEGEYAKTYYITIPERETLWSSVHTGIRNDGWYIDYIDARAELKSYIIGVEKLNGKM